jgi:DNA polymerase/3'-5' exonuclease PolX
MKYDEALQIGTWLTDQLRETCEFEPPMYMHRLCTLAGGLRRLKDDVHDIEVVAKPILKAPRPEFGKPVFISAFDKILFELEKSGHLKRIKGKDKMKQYAINLELFGLKPMLNPFTVEFYLVTPPAQWGVNFAIRTGPGSPGNNFSKWIVTTRKAGGRLPDGYRVKHAAVWRQDQIDAKGEPFKGEKPLDMPLEEDFLDFLNLGWIEPKDRVARWNIARG